ncbi:hypothetical protein Q3V94_08445 [Caloramator sp. CAR-1]|uniref:hypothetical protein n=1 Tax=Caloramator sp. CAR-1 TaxID=3062777 RepID=UPI0026E21584|nr:hypothetical protein [Caloramator sp. CAR-1]MDO6355106.1 hypothetical protein [Caloramator sp. CAR-1]
MYPVTQDFLDKVRATERRVWAKCQIDYTDPFLDQSIQVQASEQANVSFPAQTADAVAEPFAKIASLDGSWVLDGTYALAPATEETKIYQMGWWGSQLADANGYFTTPYPTLTLTFYSRPVTKLQVVGDNKRGEYPVDFTIRLYDSAGILLYTENVIGNTQVWWQKSLSTPVTQVAKITFEFKRWSHPGRQVKIMEVFTNIQEIYEGEDIILLHLLEEREVSQGSLPIGNISANEIDVRILNRDRKFDVGNIQSPLYGLLKANRRIKAWLGVETTNGIEYVPLGTFYTGDWSVPENSIYAQTTGRDKLELLRKNTYTSNVVEINKTLYDLAISVLQNAGLKPDDYWIDTELQQYTIPYAYFEPQSHREALRKIAEACLGQVYCDRNGIIRVEGPSYLASKTTADLTITQDDYFRKDNPVKWGQIANYIEVETQPLRPDTMQEVYRSNDPISIAAGQTLKLTVYYNQTPCINASASLVGATNTVITAATYYAWGADITLVNNGTATESITIVVNAQPLKVMNKEKAIAKDDASITDNGLIRYTFPTNPLVQTLSMAQTIANKLLQSFKDPRRDVEVEWRGNPALLLGDRVSVVDNIETNDYYVIRQELEYDGALRAKLSGRKA